MTSYWDGYWNRTMARRRLLAGGATTAVGLAGLMAGCGGDNDDDSPAGNTAPAGTTSTTGASSATATPANEPVRGGTLQAWRPNDFIRENFTAASGPAQEFVGMVYSQLLAPKVSRSWRDAYAYQVRPDLAASYEQPDKTTYTFKVDPSAKFQPKAPTNGRAATAEDVIASLDRFITEPKNTMRTDFARLIDSYKAIDPATVQIKTKAPYSPFIQHLIAFSVFRVYPKELVADDELRTSDPNGTGPFVLKEFRPGSYWDFVANPTHHVKDSSGRKRPYIDAVRFNVIPDQAQQIVQFNAGRIDLSERASYNMLQEVQGQVKGLDVIESYPTVWSVLVTQQKAGSPFTDMRLRQAVSMALDRNALLKIQGNDGSWCNFIGPNMGNWFLDPRGSDAGPNGQYFKYNPGEAKKLIDAAGLSGQTVNFIYPNLNQALSDEALVVADQLQKVGLKLSVQQQDYATKFLPAAGKGSWGGGEFDGIIYYWRGGYAHPYQMFSLTLYTGGTWNNGHWSDTTLDGMIDKLGAEFDNAAQLKQTYDIQRYAMEKHYSSPVITNLAYNIAQPWVRNAQLNTLYQRDAEALLWFKDKKA